MPDNTKTMLPLALALANQGFHVFPCMESGENIKKPYTLHGFKDASLDPKRIEEWWTNHPNALPAIACGKSRLFVIDCDKDEKGNDTGLRNLMQAFKAYGVEMPKTLTVGTPSGGKHFYFTITEAQAGRLPDIGAGWDFDKHKARAGTCVDFRSTGGYVIAPYATLPTGEVYLPEDCVAVDLLLSAIAPLPDTIASLFVKRQAVSSSAPDYRPLPASNERTLFDDVANALANAPAGVRNDKANEVAYTFGGFVGAGRIGTAEAREYLIRACEDNGLMADEPEKTMQTIERAFAEGMKNPAQALANPYHYGQTYGRQTRTEQRPLREIVFQSVANSWDAVSETLTNSPDPIHTGLEGLDRAIGGGLRPGLTVVGAVPACGKSALMLQVADHIASTGRNVLFYALEMSASELRERTIIRDTSVLLKNEAESDTPASANEVARTLRAMVRRKVSPSVGLTKCEDDYRTGAGKHLYIRDGVFGQDEENRPTVEGICEDVEAFIETHEGLPVVIVDYLQLLRCRDNASDRTEYDRMNVASLALKRLSAHGFPVIVISSFARSSYYTRPSLDSFKGSGGIEYTASCALVLGFREMVDADVWTKGEGYNHAVLDKYRGDDARIPARLEARCVKARDFLPASCELAFYGAFFRFDDVAPVDFISPAQVADRYKEWAGKQTQRRTGG